jgi:hypothetical protein
MKKKPIEQSKIKSIEGLIEKYLTELSSNKNRISQMSIQQWLGNKIANEYGNNGDWGNNNLYVYDGDNSNLIRELDDQKISTESVVEILSKNKQFQEYIKNEYQKHFAKNICDAVKYCATNVKRQDNYIDSQKKLLIKKQKSTMEKSILVDKIKEKFSKEDIKKLETEFKIKIG